MTFRARLAELNGQRRNRVAVRKAMGSGRSMFDSARGIIGPTGNSFSKGWEMLANDKGAYLRSMQSEQHLPPSLFVSERDRVRLGQPVPLAERCIEDYRSETAMPVGEWDISEIENTTDPDST